MVPNLVAGPSIFHDLWTAMRPATVLVLTIVVEEVVFAVLNPFRRLLSPGLWPLFHVVLWLLLCVGLVTVFLGSLVGFPSSFATSLASASSFTFLGPGVMVLVTRIGSLPMRLVGTSLPASSLSPAAGSWWSVLRL